MRALLFIFYISLFLTPKESSSQTKSDSLKRLIRTEHIATKKADLLFKLAQSYRRKHSDSSIYFANQSFKISKNISYHLGIANSSIAMAWAYYTKSNYTKANELALQAMKSYEKCGDQKAKIGTCYRLLAAMSTKEKKSEEALQHLLNAKDLYNDPSIKNKEVKSLVLNDIAYLYLEMDNYTMAMKHLNESIKTAKKNDQTSTLADCYNIMATISSRQKDYDKAIIYYNLSKDIYSQKKDALGVAICNTNLGITYYKKDSPKTAISFLENSKKQCEAIKFTLGIVESLTTLGRAYTKLKEPHKASTYLTKAIALANTINIGKNEIILAQADLAYHNGDYLTAINLLENQLQKNSLKLFPKEKIELYKSLSRTYKTTKKYKKSLLLQDELIHLQDSISSTQKTIQVRVLQAEFNYAKIKNDLKNRDTELAVTKAKAKNSKLANILLIVAGIAILTIIFLIYQRRKHLRKARKENWKIKQELQATKQKQLDNEINYKNQQLTDFALHISEKNELLLSLKKKIKSLALIDGSNNKKINNLILFLNNNMEQNKEKVALYSVADNTKDSFYYKLVDLYPELTEKEKRVAALVRLNLASKQIGIQLNITKASVDNYRHSLRKKMKVPKNMYLYDFIKNI